MIIRANRSFWDGWADEYQADHADVLGVDQFVWCPEGLEEIDLGLLGDVRDQDVLELGCGAGQCSRWLVGQGARAIGIDLSFRQLQHSRRLDAETGCAVPTVCADATQLPFDDATFDIAFSAFGAVQFVPDSAALLREVARVLRPGGRWAFSVTHPIRWAFLDEPDEGGLVVCKSYFDRSPYVEHDADGRVAYAEQHRTLGDRVREIVQAGFVLEGLIEPEWPEHRHDPWDGWSRLRGELFPGTAIFTCRLDLA